MFFPTPVLVGVDGRERGRRALTVAIELCGATGSPLHLAHVKLSQWSVAGAAVGPGPQERLLREAEELLAAEAEVAGASGVRPVDTHARLAPGIAAALVRLQQENGAGLLVVGAGHTGRVAAAVQGDIAAAAARRGSGSVLVVR